MKLEIKGEETEEKAIISLKKVGDGVLVISEIDGRLRTELLIRADGSKSYPEGSGNFKIK